MVDLPMRVLGIGSVLMIVLGALTMLKDEALAYTCIVIGFLLFAAMLVYHIVVGIN